MTAPASFERTRIWHKRFVLLAEHIAGYSKDPRRKVGAILVTPDRRSIAIGYNGFPRRFGDTEERLNDREIKNEFMVHAERNALDNARFGMRGTTLYATKFPCLECMKGIVQTGVKNIVSPDPNFDHPRWGYSHLQAVKLMKETSIGFMCSTNLNIVRPAVIMVEIEIIDALLLKSKELMYAGRLEEAQSILSEIRAALI